MKNFGRFIAETRGVPFTRRADEIELDGVRLSDAERDALLAEFEGWEPPVTAEEVKAEANRRILAQYPDWKQRNMIARSTELHEKRLDGETLTVAEQDEAGALQAAWDWVKFIRGKSDEIEAMDHIPADFTNDSYWQ